MFFTCRSCRPYFPVVTVNMVIYSNAYFRKIVITTVITCQYTVQDVVTTVNCDAGHIESPNTV